MSEEALDKAKLQQLCSENNQLNNTVHAFSGQLRARKQVIDELFEANINLRSSNILMEDKIKQMQSEAQSLIARIQVLEKEKTDLIKKELDEAQVSAVILD